MTKNSGIILIGFNKENRMFVLQIGDEFFLELGEFRELVEVVGQFLRDAIEKYLRGQKV